MKEFKEFILPKARQSGITYSAKMYWKILKQYEEKINRIHKIEKVISHINGSK